MEKFLSQFNQHSKIQEFIRFKNWSYDDILQLSPCISVERLASQFPELVDENDRNILANAIMALNQKDSQVLEDQCDSFVEEKVEVWEELLRDDEWVELHQKILEEREKKNLTISEFLMSCGLSPHNSYFKQLSSKGRQQYPPAKRRNTPGKQFRDAVTKYFNEDHAPTELSVGSLGNVLFDWRLDNNSYLHKLHISGIRLADPNSTELIVGAYRQCELTKQDIETMLMKDDKIREALNGASLTVIAIYEHWLLSLGPPLCALGHSLGTTTVINANGGIVALTCGHVIHDDYENCDKSRPYPVSYCDKDRDTNKFLKQSFAHRLGSAWIHHDLDIAGIIPSVEHPVTVNVVEELEVSVKFIKWWADDEALITRLNFLQNSNVTKCGISSRKTTGVVVAVNYESFFVEGLQVTPFAIPGDSGSLVLNGEGVVLGVVSEIEFRTHSNSYVSEVLPVWLFYEWVCDLKFNGV